MLGYNINKVNEIILGISRMQYGLNEEQEMIVSTVRNFVEKEIYPHEEPCR